MNKLREEIRSLLSAADCVRPAALRRSLRDDYLYATDLPQAASAETVAEFRHRAEEAGWRTEESEGWIQLDMIARTDPADVFSGPFGPEAWCCASILRRHPGNRRKGAREKRMLLKAGEESPETYERVCGILHREWAAALRKGEALPDLTEEYFQEGTEKC